MMKVLILWSLAMTLVAGEVPPATYGDVLLLGTMTRHGDVRAIRIRTADNGGPIVVTRGQFDPDKATVVPLTNSMGAPIGEVAIQSNRSGEAAQIAAEIGRRIYQPGNLTDSDPFVAGAGRGRLAQAIVDRMIDRHPRLVTLAMHVAPPGRDNIILASNFGRIGKAADDDDRRVSADGVVLREATDGGRRLAVELPQFDAEGRVVGALSTSFVVTPDHGADQAYADAVALRDEIARATPSLAALAAR